MSIAILIGLALAVLVALALLSASIHVMTEYERAVIFRLGRIQPLKGPGLIFISRSSTSCRVNLRTHTYDIPPQDVITKDNVTVRVNAVAYFNVVDAIRSVLIDRRPPVRARSQVAQTTLRASSASIPRRPAHQARRDQPTPPADHRRGHRPVGREGDDRRGQGRHPPREHAPRHGPPGRGGARSSGQGDPRDGREGGRGQPRRGGQSCSRLTPPRCSCVRWARCWSSGRSTTRRSSSRCRWSCSGCSTRRRRHTDDDPSGSSPIATRERLVTCAEA